MRILQTLSLLAIVVPSGAQAADVVIQRGVGRECYMTTLLELNPVTGTRGLAACDAAVAAYTNMPRDLAGSLVNRGQILIGLERFEEAVADADRAIAIDPRLAAAFINRGGALVGLRRYEGAIVSLNRAIALGGERLELAYYDRALADDHLGNIRGAYLDYRKSSGLNPDFPLPTEQLPRFQVAYH